MTDLGLATKIFFGIAGACVVLIIIVFLARRIRLPSKERIHLYMPGPPIKVPLEIIPESSPRVIETKQPPIEYDPAYIMSLQNRIYSLETKLAQVDKRVHNTDMLDDNLIVRAFAVWAHYLVAMFVLVIFFALVLCLFSVLSNIR